MIINIHKMTDQDVEEIKKIVKEYIKIDDSIKEISSVLKENRKVKNDLESQIKDYMINNDLGKVDIGSGILRISKTKPSKSVNRKGVLNILVDSLKGDHDTANKITEEIFDNKDAEEVIKLERKSTIKKI